MSSDNDIPVVSFAPFLSGSVVDREQTASAIDVALKSDGFLYLTDHGINQDKIDTLFQLNKQFFKLSELEKKSASNSPSQCLHGYSATGDEKIRDKICMKESFDCGNPENNTMQSNNWPPEEHLPGFRNFTEDFFEDCTKLTHQLFDCLSLSLNLPSDGSLGKYHAHSLFDLTHLHYPSVSAQRLRSGEITRNLAHSDFGTLTLLFQDDVGGLEIVDLKSTNTVSSAEAENSGRFKHIDPKPGTIVVNIGYLLMRWSNGRWKNTIHRVSEPRAGTPGEGDGIGDKTIPQRHSIAFFSSPDPETIVEALPGCWSEQVPKKWKPINAGDYLRRKTAAMYT